MQKNKEEQFFARVRQVSNNSYLKLPFPDILEKSYRDYYLAKRRHYYLITILLGAIFYASYTLIDFVLIGESYSLTVLVRFGLVVPVIIFTLWALSYFKVSGKHDDLMIGIGALSMAASVLFIEYLAFTKSLNYYNSGTILIITYFNIIIQINFRTSLIVTTLIVIAALSMFLYLDVGNDHFILLFFDHIAIAIMTLAVNYFVQLQHRKAYFKNLLLKYSNQKLVASENRLKEMVDLDSLTGVANRRVLTKLMKSDNAKECGVLFIDIDHFKKYNDQYGHSKGDECLIEIAELISKSIRKEDTCIRYGGEEFIVCFDGITKQRVLEIAENIRSAIENSKIRHVDSPYGYLTVSIGIDYRDNVEKTLEQIIDTADKALYKAKELGRNRVVAF